MWQPKVTRTGLVVGLSESEQLLVRFESTRCANCQCSRVFFGDDGSAIEVRLPADTPGIETHAIGQQVTLRVGAQPFSQAALLLFGLPVLLALLGCGLASATTASVEWQALSAVAGGSSGWLMARISSNQLLTVVSESLAIDTADC